MAKKAKAVENTEVAPQPVAVKTAPSKTNWEIKDRRYFLVGRGDPLTYVLASKSTPRKPLLWFDEEKGYNREIRYASNQKSCFVDEQDNKAILRVELGSAVDKMSSAELKRDLYMFARNNPILFLDLVNDENVVLRNLAIKAAEMGIIKLSQDQRTFAWGSNDRKLMTVPFEENPYSAFAAFLKTDEGVEIFKSIEKKLK